MQYCDCCFPVISAGQVSLAIMGSHLIVCIILTFDCYFNLGS